MRTCPRQTQLQIDTIPNPTHTKHTEQHKQKPQPAGVVPDPTELSKPPSSAAMGLQSNEGGVAFSSIALLQQRFRELERIREKREERLLQMLVPRATEAPTRETPVKWFFHPELLYPCRPLRDTASALFPASAASECKTFQLLGTVELWPSKAYKHVPSEVDVDTSLHL